MGQERGTTLLEVVIASVILGVLMTATMVLMNTMANQSEMEKNISRVEQDSLRLVDQISEILAEATLRDESQASRPLFLATLDEGADEIEFQVPVDYDRDGDYQNPEGEIDWGAKIWPMAKNAMGVSLQETLQAQGCTLPNPEHFLNLRAKFVFLPTDTFTEKEIRLDIDGDGIDHELDVWERGSIALVFPQGSGSVVEGGEVKIYNLNGDYKVAFFAPFVIRRHTSAKNHLASSHPLYAKHNNLKDYDLDGESDPMFVLLEEGLVKMTFFVCDPQAQKPFYKKRVMVVDLRNM